MSNGTGAGGTINIQAQSTEFSRFGTSDQRKGYFLFGDLVSYLVGSYVNAGQFGGLTPRENAFLTYILSQDPQCLPGGLTLQTSQDISWSAFPGSAELQAIWTQDPFSVEFENNTEAAYTRAYSIARSIAQSGPTNVRGGTARQGFELAELDTQFSIQRFEAIWRNKLAVAQIVMNAVHIANNIEEARRSASLQAQKAQAATEQGRVQQGLAACEATQRMINDGIRANAAGAEFLGVPQMVTTEDMSGQGFQQGIQTSFGASYWR